MAKTHAQRGAVTAKSLALILVAGTATALLFRWAEPRDDGLHYRQPGGALAAQAVRLEIIQGFVDTGVIVSMKERDTTLRLEVGEAYAGLPLPERQQIASVVCAYYATQDERISSVTLFNRTGTRIGRFSPTDGGLKLE